MKGTIVVFLSVLAVGLAVTLWSKGYLPTLTQSKDPVVEAIQKRGKLIVGTDPTYPPMENTDPSGRIIGFDADLAAALASSLGVALELRKVPFDNLIEAAKQGDVDVAISSISITEERSQSVLFSRPYLNAGQAIITASGNTTIELPEDLQGKKVAAQSDTTSFKEAQRYTNAANVISYPADYSDIVLKLKKGTIDAIIMDYPAASDLVRQHAGTKLVGKPFTSEFYGIVTRKENKGLIEVVNIILADLKKTGKLSAFESKWLE